MAPPLTLGAKIIEAIIVLVLVRALILASLRFPDTEGSLSLAIFGAVSVIVLLEGALPRAFGGFVDDRGLIATLIGAIAGASFLRIPQTKSPERNTPKLQLIALPILAGPLFGLILAALTILFFNVHSLDRINTFQVLTLLGAITGLIAAVIVTIATASAWFRTKKSLRNNIRNSQKTLK